MSYRDEAINPCTLAGDILCLYTLYYDILYALVYFKLRKADIQQPTPNKYP